MKADKRKKTFFRILHTQYFYQSVREAVILFIYRVHVDAVGVGPGVLEVLLQPLPQWVWNLVKAYELLDPQHLSVIAGRTGVQPLDDGRDVSKNTGVHEGCNTDKVINR